jgi:RNA polymerase sigma-70 factor (ECF subfamily)
MNPGGAADTHRTIERVARESYGRLLARLIAHTRDVASAEDVLGDALVAALATWPRDGVPKSPEAWLVAAARNFYIDRVRHDHVVQAHESVMTAPDVAPIDPSAPADFPDERLKLLFVCAHPAIDPAMHTPLMLQTVLGLDAARIAQAFLISPATMGQRLVRVKTKIRVAGIPFEVPQPNELGARLDAVLEAVYAAFGIGWSAMPGADERGRELAEESIWLARVLLELMPDEPEVLGLLSLMLHCEARRAARREPDGRYVPLSEQNPRRWSLGMIDEAERCLGRASASGRPGRFQLEAAIQSVHSERVRDAGTNWAAIVVFYQQLVAISPTLGARTGSAAAVGEATGPAAGLAALDTIARHRVSTYQPYWAVRAHLLRRLGRSCDASEAFDRAIGLAEDPAVRAFLLQRRG